MPAIEQLLADFQERPLPAVSPRLVQLPETPGVANVVIGMRRSGKTYRLYQEMHRLLAAGVDKRRILYINFEDDRLQPLGPDTPERVLETFYRGNPAARTEGAYLFLDEIQAVDGWSRFARRVLDTENARVYVTGSSAKMLSTEVSTEFRGRGHAVELLPFSLAESLLYDGMQLPRDTPGARERSRLEAALVQYLQVGGFPDVQPMDEPNRIQTLQDYLQLVLLRDIIERHEIRNPHAARYFALSLLQSAGSPTSVNRLSGDLKSRGIAVGKDTLYALLDHFSDAFLLFPVPVFARSLRERESNPKKIYPVDPGLAFAVASSATENVGARLEMAVYLELRRRLRGTRDGTISYYLTTSRREVDFIVGDPELGDPHQLIQACADLSNPITREREMRALAEAMAETGIREAMILTLHESDTVEVPEGTVRVVPAWEWLLADALLE